MTRRARTVVLGALAAFVASHVIWLCFAAITTGSLDHAAENNLKKQQAELAAQWEQVRTKVEADEARWADHPLLTPRDGGDAAQLLQAHIRWEHADAGAPIPKALASKLQPDAGWPANFAELDVAAVDTSWMSQLAQFAYFDVESAGSPVEAEPWHPSSEPLPEFIDLQLLARVHLTRGLQSSDARPAARDVREAARLFLTSETLLGGAVAETLLSIERRAYEEARRRGHDLSDWQPVTVEDRSALLRLLFAAPAPYVLSASGSLAETTPRVGQCLGLRSSLGWAHEARFYAQDVVPERYAALTRALQDAPCRLRRPRAAWASNEADGQWNCERGNAPENMCFSPAAMKLPFMKSVIGRTIVGAPPPQFFRRYFE